MGKLILKIAPMYSGLVAANSDDVELKGDLLILKDTIYVGRGKEMGIVFLMGGASGISGKHMAFVKYSGDWHITDTSSKNGTYLKRDAGTVKQIKGEFEIQKGDEVCLASQNNVTFKVVKC